MHSMDDAIAILDDEQIAIAIESYVAAERFTVNADYGHYDGDVFFVDAMLVLLPQLGLAPVACAMDGAEAIAVVREHDPDVVLVDLEMPFVDGVEAIKEISRISPNTTLLAVTGFTDPQRAADAVAAGALACLSKTDVRERLEALIGQGS